MVAYFVRYLKRFGVLVVGLVAIVILAVSIFPFWDKRVPFIIALFFTWIIGAYILFPLAVRIIRVFVRPHHIPLHTVTPDGFACDPVNVGIVGSLQELRDAMEKAGWYEADPRTLGTLWHMGISILANRPYPTAPFSPLYLFGRKQDIGFEMPVQDSPRQRHHVRFWLVDPATSNARFLLRRHIVPKDRLFWVGAVTQDIGLGFITHNLQLTHKIDPDTNAERDFLVSCLKKACKGLKIDQLNSSTPYTLPNRIRTITMIADGRLTLCEL